MLGCGAMATWSTDLGHCPPQDAADVALAARRRGEFCRAVVEAATSRKSGPMWRCAVGCIGRVGRKKCAGWVDVVCAPDQAVGWSCGVCGDHGVITGVAGSPSDLSRYVPRGKTRVWGYDEEERKVLAPMLSALPELRALLARGTPRDDVPGLILAEGTVAELDAMYSLVEALMDARGGRRRGDILDGLLRGLCTAIDGF